MTNDVRNAGARKTLPLVPLLFRLGGTKRIADIPDNDLPDLASHCEVWGQRWGYLVVLGVVIDVWLAFKTPSHNVIIGKYGPVIASGCVALGVWLEIIFSKLGSKFHREFVRRSNNRLRDAFEAANKAHNEARAVSEKVANANSDAAVAYMETVGARIEAGKFHERAARAELETEKLRRDFGWRALTVETAERLVSIFSAMPGTRLKILFPDQDLEARNFATQLMGQFIRSGWFVTSEAASHDTTFDMGISVRQGASKPGRLILGALQELGFQANSGWALDIPEEECDSRCELRIGPKRMPSAMSDEAASVKAE